EKDSGVIQIKDLILGSKIAQSATLEEWKENPAQREVSRGDLVTTVQAMLKSQS
ncbi:MAG: histidine--tRNA ligase, partial [Paracoccaceae bacterium]